MKFFSEKKRFLVPLVILLAISGGAYIYWPFYSKDPVRNIPKAVSQARPERFEPSDNFVSKYLGGIESDIFIETIVSTQDESILFYFVKDMRNNRDSIRYFYPFTQREVEEYPLICKIISSQGKRGEGVPPENDPIRLFMMDDFIKREDPRNIRFLAKEKTTGKIIGFAGVDETNDKDVLSLFFYVHSSERGKRHAVKIIGGLESYCLKIGVKKIMDTVSTENKPARKTHESAGFKFLRELKKGHKCLIPSKNSCEDDVFEESAPVIHYVKDLGD